MYNLEGKVALITGGSRGLGYATVEKFLKEGCRVITCARNKENLDAAVEKLRLISDKVEGYALDILDKAAVRKMVAEVDEKYGGVDILINNAAANGVASFEDSTDEMWEYVVNANVLGTYYCCKAVLPAMLKKGSGVITNIASISYTGGSMSEYVSHYGASKAAIWSMTRTIAKELSPKGIRCNSIAPGPFLTEMLFETQTEEWREDVANNIIPIRRFGMPEEIANLNAFLASDQCTYITGANIDCDGGRGL